MMRKVYLSFLGLGTFSEQTGHFRYRTTVYELNGRKSKETDFVQVAEMELLNGSAFDVVYIAATRKSYDTHFDSLQKQLLPYQVSPVPIILSEEMSGRGQWEWFEKILPFH